MLQRLERIFSSHQVGGRIELLYDTRLYHGHLA
jgi:hypothetical protein